MSLFDGIPLEAYDTPQAPVQELPRCVVTIKRASNGEEILLCSVSPPPADVQKDARTRGLPLFTLAEIPTMRHAAAADPRFIDNLIAARRTFGWGGEITFSKDSVCPGA